MARGLHTRKPESHKLSSISERCHIATDHNVSEYIANEKNQANAHLNTRDASDRLTKECAAPIWLQGRRIHIQSRGITMIIRKRHEADQSHC